MSEKRGCLGFFLELFQPAPGTTATTGTTGRTAEPLPYRRKDYLLTKGERSFFDALLRAVDPDRYHLFGKVRFEDLLWIPKNTERRGTYRNYVKSRHIDFLICDRTQIRPLLAIELDDASHRRADRRERDDFLNAACRAAGLPLLRIPAAGAYDPDDLARRISPFLPAPTTTATRTP